MDACVCVLKKKISISNKCIYIFFLLPPFPQTEDMFLQQKIIILEWFLKDHVTLKT